MRIIKVVVCFLFCTLAWAACGAPPAPSPSCDPATDPNACGMASQCKANMRDCNNKGLDGCETDVTADVNNCGGCGQVCPKPGIGQAVCNQGVCGSVTCSARYLDCNGDLADSCETDSQTDINHCGGCGTACNFAQAIPSCTAGACGIQSCNAGFQDCNQVPDDGCEVDAAGDPNNCGACGNVCPANAQASAACNAGACSVSCNAGFGDCDANPANGCEVDLTSASTSCGGCGMACGMGQACNNSTCIMATNFDVADGPLYGSSPMAYTCQEACAFLFGNSPTSWACSILPESVTHTAWGSGFGDDSHCSKGGTGMPVAENEDFGTVLYSLPGSFSTYVRDWCKAGDSINYCFLTGP